MNKKLLFVFGLAFPVMVVAHGDPAESAKEELRLLREEIKELRMEIKGLTNVMRRQLAEQNRRGDLQEDEPWGCMMNDIRAGSLYSAGKSEMEARSRVMSDCKNKKGACFESNLSCEKAE